jgi:Fur family iron response transcriptional regulator
MVTDTIGILRRHGIQPSAQRVSVAAFVLATDTHPSAEEVWRAVKKHQPTLSRATVYNTLNLFVSKGLLRALTLAEGRIVFDPHVVPHHHFIDERTGRIYDLGWEALEVRRLEQLRDFEVHDYQVVLRGKRRGNSNNR